MWGKDHLHISYSDPVFTVRWSTFFVSSRSPCSRTRQLSSILSCGGEGRIRIHAGCYFRHRLSVRIRSLHAFFEHQCIVYEVQNWQYFHFRLLIDDRASALKKNWRRRRVISMPSKLHGAETRRFTKRNRVRRKSSLCFLPSSWTESLDRSRRIECLFKNPIALQSSRRKYRIV